MADEVSSVPAASTIDEHLADFRTDAQMVNASTKACMIARSG